MKKSKKKVAIGTAALAAGLLASASNANAQVKTFHLDRLESGGSPDDGIAVFRPVTEQRNILFGQMAIGYALRPLRTRAITVDPGTLGRSSSSVVQDQLAIYGNVGFEILDRAILGLQFPWYIQSTQNPNYPTGNITGVGQAHTTFVGTGAAAAGDLRLDFRYTVARSDDRKQAFGVQVLVVTPTGTTDNLGGDNGLGAMVFLTGETRILKIISLDANLGLAFRPAPGHVINDPVDGSGLGVGNELRWGIGAFMPLGTEKLRVGASLFGSTGIQDNNILGNTFLTARNTPIEWQGEARLRLGPSDHWWVGAGAGSRFFVNAYGAPDFRIVGLVGTYIPIFEEEPKQIKPKKEVRAEERAQRPDRDHDGIPDDVDPCPDEPEDHLGADPNDGCPMPPDRDGDGILDQYDKCPDVPEDKDGIDDGDGCPEDDADGDGIPDTQDACPKEPGQKNEDPKKNGCPTFIKVEGNTIRILQQVHFATGKAEILPDSFPMLNEIALLMKSNKGIKKLSIEGHTDNRGGADMNKKLSESRTQSVKKLLVDKGVEADRLEAHGFGLEKPIEDNSTEAGRAANRRVEFKILEEEDSNSSSAPKK